MEQLDLPLKTKTHFDERQLFLPKFGIIKNAYIGKDGVLRDAFCQPSTLFDRIYEAHAKRKAGQLIDPAQARRERDWNVLANRTVRITRLPRF